MLGSIHDTVPGSDLRLLSTLLPTAMPSATTIKPTATAKVNRIPVATASGRAVVMSVVDDAMVNTAPMTDTPVISPRLRDRLRRPEITPLWSGRISFKTAVLLAVWNSAYPMVTTTSVVSHE